MPRVVKVLNYGSFSYSGEFELAHSSLSFNGARFPGALDALTDLGRCVLESLWVCSGVERLSFQRYSVEIFLSAAVPRPEREPELDLVVGHWLRGIPVWDGPSRSRLGLAELDPEAELLGPLESEGDLLPSLELELAQLLSPPESPT